MVISHNLSAMFAERHLGVTEQRSTKEMEKVSSGIRINHAADDASGLAVSEKMRSQIRGLNRASANAMDGISFIQTSEGYLQETQDILHRLRELAVQSANGIYTSEDRTMIQVEVDQLVDEIDRIASHAQFNGYNMLTGSFSNGEWGEATASMWFHMGANMDQRERVYISTMTAAGLGLRGLGETIGVRIESPDDANRAIGTVDKSLRVVNKQRADLGAYQNRLEYAMKGIDNGAENIQAAESRIRDANMASEMVDYVKDQVLTQSGIAMLAQANVSPQSVLSLMR
ncbi:MAG: flagellin [Termitinemataceae bacterium]|nr:MAG: flagellin [Termitinemataceae bacterium]